MGFAARHHPLYQELLQTMYATKKLGPVHWRPAKISPIDLQVIDKESTGTPFDTLNLRQELNTQVAVGRARIYAHECDFARIITLTDLPYDPTPLREWGYLIRTFGKPAGNIAKTQVLWFASRRARFFPEKGRPLGPEHVNGGYCMACEPNTVVIYRLEDATRVLIHELLHGFCTDAPISPTNSVELMETATEAWAEIILAAGREIGIAAPHPLPGALDAQLQWVALQNVRLRRDHSVQSSRDYAWRYTIGKEAALIRMGFLPYIQKYRNVSMRLTPPVSRNPVF
jgi:hypothetical protein